MKNKNYCLNFIKGIACFGVVYMHTSYDCLLSAVIVCAFRFAVPIFFMISGYYIYYKDRSMVLLKAKKRCIHIVKLFLYAYCVNQIWTVILTPLLQNRRIELKLLYKNFITLAGLKKILLFNQLGGILWFLLALIYCYLLIIMINKLGIYKLAYIVAVLLIIGHIIIRGYIQYNSLVPEETNIIWFRNVWFMGFPFFMMGNLIHRKEEVIKTKIDSSKNKLLIALVLLGIIISFAERYIVVLEVYWGTLMAVFAMFIYAIINSEKTIVPIVSTIGEKYSMQIYIYQMIVYSFLMISYNKLGINNIVLLIVNPLIIYALIALLCWVKDKLIKKVRHE